MEKKRINKLVVPLTIKSLSVLGAFTVMTSSLASCKSNKKTSSDNSSSIITSSSEDAVIDNNSEEIEINSSSNDESVTAGIDSKPNSNTNNNQSKSNTQKPSTGNKNNTTNNNQQPNQNNNNNNNNIQPSQGESSDEFIPLNTGNINDVNIFDRAVLEVAQNTRGGFGGIWHYYYQEKLYSVYGFPYDEFKYLLSAMNKNYLNNQTLNKLIGNYSEDEIKRFMYILDTMISFVESSRKTNNWNGLIVNSKDLNDINNIEKGFLDYRYNNNAETIRNLLNNYNINENNPIIGYYLIAACNNASRGSSLKDQDIINKYIDLSFEIESKCESLAIEMYNRSHGKAKVLE